MSARWLWTGLALVPALGARVLGKVPRGVGGISIDTRTLEADDLFVALRGLARDGHDFVADAFRAGAAAALVDEHNAERYRGLGTLYIVPDTMIALENLARAARQRSRAQIVAVTGSVGKTSTKDMLKLVLSDFGAVHASIASYNNHWGVPLTLARMPKDSRYGVFEIGMNHAGEITPLVAMVRPHVAIVTTVAPVHIEHFDSVEAIADAKAEIFSGLEKGGVAIVHRDIPQYERLLYAAHQSPADRIVSFGEHEGSHARLAVFYPAADHSDILADVMDRRLSYTLGAPGRHMALNSLAVLLALQALRCDLDKASARFESFSTPEGRGRHYLLGSARAPVRLVDESYNANPASMRAALCVLGDVDKGIMGRRIAVLGDMLELGHGAVRMHQALLAEILAHEVDLVFVAGPLMAHLFDALPEDMRGFHADSAAALLPHLMSVIRSEDVIMIKGSNSMGMKIVVTALVERLGMIAGTAHSEDGANAVLAE
jgi:UDP-N-acetylmuramoyl-tripeptide--D-alanyl-D-alanine ligase